MKVVSIYISPSFPKSVVCVLRGSKAFFWIESAEVLDMSDAEGAEQKIFSSLEKSNLSLKEDEFPSYRDPMFFRNTYRSPLKTMLGIEYKKFMKKACCWRVEAGEKFMVEKLKALGSGAFAEPEYTHLCENIGEVVTVLKLGSI